MSYRKVGKGKYIVEVEKTINGNRRRKTETVYTKSKGKDLDFFIKKKEEELYRIISNDSTFRYSDYKFEEFAELLLNNWVAKQRTKDSYKQILSLRTIDFFKGQKITNIEKQDIKRFIYKLKTEISSKTGKRLSNKTIEHYRNTLRVLFNYAKDLKIIDENPVDGVDIPPRSAQLAHGFYEEKDFIKIRETMERHAYLKYYVFFILQTFLGARPGEVYGLKWKKIDLSTGEIVVNESLVRNSEGYSLESTKVEDQYKETLPPYISWKLEELMEIEKMKHGKYDIEDCFVFTNEKGEHLAESAFRSYFRNFCKRWDLPYIPPYGLRHTTATYLAMQNIPEVNIRQKLRHRDGKTTLKYIHATETIKEEVRGHLGDLTSPGLKLVEKID